MNDRSFRLGRYEIIEKSGEEIWWKSHVGFASQKLGKCFIEGNVLFIGPGERDEEGFLINEFLENISKFPRWNKTRYYCPSYMLYTCKDDKLWYGIEPSVPKETKIRMKQEDPNTTPLKGSSRASISTRLQMGQVKGTLGSAVRRCKELVSFGPKKKDPEK